MGQEKLSIEAELHKLQRESFTYFLHEINPTNGLVLDKTAANWPASIAATGLALASYPVAVERGFMSRALAVKLTLNTLRFFWNSPQGPESDATGYKGFYYHFLDMKTGRRAKQCELSTVDSTFLLAGILTSRIFFDLNSAQEREIRTLADALYFRVDWQWAKNQGETVTHGWKPESGFLPYRWQGYDEALLLYILGLGSPTFPLPKSSYSAWTSNYEWKHIYGFDYLYAGSLFTHQLSHIWIDFRDIQDAFMREKRVIILRIAAERLISNSNMPSIIHLISSAMVLAAGELRPAMVQVPRLSGSTVWNDNSLIISLVRYLMALMMERLPHGWPSHPCHSPLRSFSP